MPPPGGARRGLRAEEDAYGQILLAHLEGRGGEEIMERDDGLVYCGDPAEYFAPYARWPSEEKKAMRFVRGRVLDVGCGAGRASLHLQERGHEVVAIDTSPLALAVAARRGVATTRLLSVAEVDRSLGLFDTILLLRNNLGLAGSEARARALLRRLARVASDRGRLVTDSVDPARHEDDAFRDYRAGPGGARPLAQRFRVRWRRYATPWFRYLMLSPADLERLVSDSGWRIIRVIHGRSARFVVVLERTPRGQARARA